MTIACMIPKRMWRRNDDDHAAHSREPQTSSTCFAHSGRCPPGARAGHRLGKGDVRRGCGASLSGASRFFDSSSRRQSSRGDHQ